jgi:hypothetical protein
MPGIPGSPGVIGENMCRFYCSEKDMNGWTCPANYPVYTGASINMHEGSAENGAPAGAGKLSVAQVSDGRIAGVSISPEVSTEVWTHPPYITINGNRGYGAVLQAVLDTNGRISRVKILDGGKGYVEPIYVRFESLNAKATSHKPSKPRPTYCHLCCKSSGKTTDIKKLQQLQYEDRIKSYEGDMERIKQALNEQHIMIQLALRSGSPGTPGTPGAPQTNTEQMRLEKILNATDSQALALDSAFQRFAPMELQVKSGPKAEGSSKEGADVLAKRAEAYDRILSQQRADYERNVKTAKDEWVKIQAQLEEDAKMAESAAKYKMPPPPPLYTKEEIDKAKRAISGRMREFTLDSKARCMELLSDAMTARTRAEEYGRTANMATFNRETATQFALTSDNAWKTYNSGCSLLVDEKGAAMELPAANPSTDSVPANF